jgi:hypothetical protein
VLYIIKTITKYFVINYFYLKKNLIGYFYFNLIKVNC